MKSITWKTNVLLKKTLQCLSCKLCVVLFFCLLNPVQGKIKIGSKSLPIELKCEHFQSPMGVDVFQPVLSWTIKTPSTNRGVFQQAYQIFVSQNPKQLEQGIAEVWNSGKVNSSRMNNINFSGKRLKSSTKYWWRVRIWDERGIVSNYSPTAFFITGIMDSQDWKGKWISAKGAEKYAHQYKSAKSDFSLKRDLPEYRAEGPKPSDLNFSSMLLRKSLKVKAKPTRAIFHISGLGQYELSVNGKKIGDNILSPGWTDYTKTTLYDTFDISKELKNGNNAIGIILGNGMYNIQADSIRYVKFLNSYGPLKANATLRLEYADGTTELIGTDQSWTVSPGPITYSNLYGGEDYDVRLLQPGWDTDKFLPTDKWVNAILSTAPGGELKGLSCSSAPIKIIQELKPLKITRLSANKWVYDLGQNASVMPRISVKGNKGSFVRIIPAELLKPDGTVDRTSSTQDGVRPAWWQYTIGSTKTEQYFPKFFYQGARYLQVETFPAIDEKELPVVEKLSGVVVHSSAEAIGNFSSSNDLFNKIYSLVRWAQRSNMMSIMTDCPQREKQGWLEQYHLNGPSLRYNFDLMPLFRKVMNDMSDSQLANGLIPNIAPEFFYASRDINNGFRNSPEWGSSFIIVPWQQYLFNGDVSLIKTYYQRMKRYVGFLESTGENNLIYTGLGDWYDIGPKPAWGSQLTPVSFTATAIYFYDTQLMGRMAGVLGFKQDSIAYMKKSELIRQSFNKEFYNSKEKRYATGSNTTYAMPVFLGIADSSQRKPLIQLLVADIRRQGNSFNSGEVGYRFLLGALDREGYSDVIYDMNNQSDRPGYGYQLKMGATALTEKWDAGVGDFGSQNHFMSGQINEWFFHGLAGISEDDRGPGYQRIIVKPSPAGDLKWVKGSYKSIRGAVSSDWRRNEDLFTLNVTIPPNTIASIHVPFSGIGEITESGRKASESPCVKFIAYQNGYAVYQVASGSYTFRSSYHK